MLCRLGSVFAELAATYYRDEGRRIKARIERKSSGPTDLNIRYSFKVSSTILRCSLAYIISIWLSRFFGGL